VKNQRDIWQNSMDEETRNTVIKVEMHTLFLKEKRPTWGSATANYFGSRRGTHRGAVIFDGK